MPLGPTLRKISGTSIALGAMLAASACTAGVEVPPTTNTPDATARAACSQVMTALPTRVAGLSAHINESGRAAQWGNDEDSVLLNCGVAKPAGLTPGSRCDVINGVGWWAEKFEGGYRFTTIGRAAYVQVIVPSVHAPEADVINELSAAVAKDPVVTPCV